MNLLYRLFRKVFPYKHNWGSGLLSTINGKNDVYRYCSKCGRLDMLNRWGFNYYQIPQFCYELNEGRPFNKKVTNEPMKHCIRKNCNKKKIDVLQVKNFSLHFRCDECDAYHLKQ